MRTIVCKAGVETSVSGEGPSKLGVRFRGVAKQAGDETGGKKKDLEYCGERPWCPSCALGTEIRVSGNDEGDKWIRIDTGL